MGRRGFGQGGGFPAPDRQTKLLLGGLLGLYVVELMLRNLSPALESLMYSMALAPIGGGFQPYQLVTWPLVQGRGAAISVALNLVMWWLFLPTLRQLFSVRQLLRGSLAVYGGATLAGLIGGVLLPQPALQGWGLLLIAWFMLFGLKMPNSQVNLYFVLPIKAIWIAWGAAGLSTLLFIASPSVSTIGSLGGLAGAWLWNRFDSGAGRKKRLRKEAKRIEKELHQFQVFDGGRSNRP